MLQLKTLIGVVFKLHVPLGEDFHPVYSGRQDPTQYMQRVANAERTGKNALNPGKIYFESKKLPPVFEIYCIRVPLDGSILLSRGFGPSESTRGHPSPQPQVMADG